MHMHMHIITIQLSFFVGMVLALQLSINKWYGTCMMRRVPQIMNYALIVITVYSYMHILFDRHILVLKSIEIDSD